MAYRIRIHNASQDGSPTSHTDSTFNEQFTRQRVSDIAYAIHKATEHEFKVGATNYPGYARGRGPKGGSGLPGFALDLAKIRLVTSKPYCGNHPGECVAAGRRTKAGLKPASNCLEWDDWVRFHGLVNDVLDKMGVSADITTAGADVDEGRLLFCRLGTKRRQRYDWVETSRNAFNATRPVNHGTPDQFEAES